ncbi:major facilitator superfamily domain-containing protein [Aspergillus keveii]|uniref:Major facilitator superfamily domain-containing protein n=1 Tax=Aspergillus keveii TaxID=714993 RepID=A0ABR4FSN2_9EURO
MSTTEETTRDGKREYSSLRKQLIILGKAFSIVPFLRGLGSLVGPVIGGYLAEPVKAFPTVFRGNTTFEAYPYLLPNLVVIVCTAGSAVVLLFFLEETHPGLRGASKFDGLRRGCRRFKVLIGWGREEGSYEAVSSVGEDIELHDAPNRTDTERVEPELPPVRPSPWTQQVILQVLALSLLAFHKVSSDVIIPIFLATASGPAERATASNNISFLTPTAGFGMAPPSISTLLLMQAIAAVVAQLLVVPWTITRWGALRSFRWSSLVIPWLYCFTPFTAQLVAPLSIIAISVDLLVKGMLVNIGYVASAILITNTAPGPQHLATINGVAASLSCLARSVGAAVSGSMFHQGLHIGNLGLPFWTLAGVALVGAVLSWALRDEP